MGQEENKENQLTTSEFGYVKGDKVFRKGFRGLADKEVGEVRNTPEEALKYFENRFSVLERKVENILTSIESNQNKGSFLKAIEHLKQKMETYDAVGKYEDLFQKLEGAEKGLSVLVDQNREKNYKIKSDLLKELDKVKNSTEWKEATEQILEIKGNWIKTGSAEKDKEELLNMAFNNAMDFFFTKKKEANKRKPFKRGPRQGGYRDNRGGGRQGGYRDNNRGDYNRDNRGGGYQNRNYNNRQGAFPQRRDGYSRDGGGYRDRQREDTSKHNGIISKLRDIADLDDASLIYKSMVRMKKEWKDLPKVDREVYKRLYYQYSQALNAIEENHGRAFEAFRKDIKDVAEKLCGEIEELLEGNDKLDDVLKKMWYINKEWDSLDDTEDKKLFGTRFKLASRYIDELKSQFLATRKSNESFNDLPEAKKLEAITKDLHTVITNKQADIEDFKIQIQTADNEKKKEYMMNKVERTQFDIIIKQNLIDILNKKIQPA